MPAGCVVEIAVGDCDVRFTPPGGVDPSCEQFTAQHSRAAAEPAASAFMSAALQQSISIMPSMLHSLSPKCSGGPAKALPASTSKRIKDARRFFMFPNTLRKSRNQSQDLNPSFREVTFSESLSATIVPLIFW